ncbi:MAG: MBL fold metallo-hydrolase [Cyclobacteriaceae bacterium]|nr:MBL fold metallo-hydrolase [Cyclobacteriaceae bacterium]
MKKISLPAITSCATLLIAFFSCMNMSAQDNPDSIKIRTTTLTPGVYMLDCTGGFGGGNITASVGEDGILIADNMFISMMPKVQAALKKLSDKPVKFALNSHFHGDHIQGNAVLDKNTTIIAHENVRKRVGASADHGRLPDITFTDRTSLYFNGEEIRLIHLPNGHTDSDAVIYFTKSKVLHMGDMFFFGMFPAVYTNGGGDIRQLIKNLEAIIKEADPASKVVPGHGDPASMQDFQNYVAMLKETTAIVEAALKKGKTLDQLTKEKVFAKYNALGEGGAQTTDQYLGMVYKLLGGK